LAPGESILSTENYKTGIKRRRCSVHHTRRLRIGSQPEVKKEVTRRRILTSHKWLFLSTDTQPEEVENEENQAVDATESTATADDSNNDAEISSNDSALVSVVATDKLFFFVGKAPSLNALSTTDNVPWCGKILRWLLQPMQSKQDN
jgi:hypothetical protein